MAKSALKIVASKTVAPSTVTYAFAKETPGTWRFDADIPEGTRLPVGSNSVYLDKAKFPKCPDRVTATFSVE